jgi:hypothetical protein
LRRQLPIGARGASSVIYARPARPLVTALLAYGFVMLGLAAAAAALIGHRPELTLFSFAFLAGWAQYGTG